MAAPATSPVNIIISHEDTECARPGECATYYTENICEDHTHRAGLLNFFSNLTTRYLEELQHYHTILYREILIWTRGSDQNSRSTVLRMYIENYLLDREGYKLALEESHLKYHQRLMAYDAEFFNEVMVITDEDSEKTPDEIEAGIDLKYQKRKKDCAAMFREQLAESKKIREEMRVEWEQHRSGVAIFADPDPLITPCPNRSDSREVRLRTPLVLLWNV